MNVTDKLKRIKEVLHTRIFDIKDKLFCATKHSNTKYDIYNLKPMNKFRYKYYICNDSLRILNADVIKDFDILKIDDISMDDDDTVGILSRDGKYLVVKKDNGIHSTQAPRGNTNYSGDIIFYKSPLEIEMFNAMALWEKCKSKHVSPYLNTVDIYTLQPLLKRTRTIEHIVPQLVWKGTGYNKSYINDVYNIAFTKECLNQLRSSIPFGNVTDINVNFSLHEYTYAFHNNLHTKKIKNEMETMVRRKVEMCMAPDFIIRESDDKYDKTTDVLLSASLPVNLIKVHGHRKIMYCPITCIWEPPNRTKGIIARAVLLMMTIHYALPFITGEITHINRIAAFWFDYVIPVLVEWDSIYFPNEYETQRCPGNIFVTKRLVSTTLGALMYT